MEVAGSILLSITQSVLFYGKEIGISMLLFEIIFNGIIYYILYKKNKIKNNSGLLLFIPIILLSSTYFIFSNKIFYISNLFIIILLNLIMFVILVNEKCFLKNYLFYTSNLIINIFSNYKESINYTKNKSEKYILKNKKLNKENIKNISKSILIVFIVVGIVLILLSSADIVLE